jgi:IS30 family transposase
MTASTGAGSAMQLDVTRTRFAKDSRGGSKQLLDTGNIPEIRKLLRTDKSIAEIAEHFGVDRLTLRSFIKRRAICDMRARTNFITLQRSIAREEARIAQMESSRIVGGRAQTQALLRAPIRARSS